MPEHRPKWGGRRAARLRSATLDAYGTVCHLCGRPGADSADHLIPRSLGGPDTLDNLRPAHLACNQSRGAGTLPTAVTVITGPPAAGKTTYAAEHAAVGDVVIDFDALAVALQAPGAPSHAHAEGIAHVAAAARSAAIAAATGPRGRAAVWLIDTNPNHKRVAAYRARGWRIVTVDPGRDVVERRALDRPARALDTIAEWYGDRPAVADSATPNPSRDW